MVCGDGRRTSELQVDKTPCEGADLHVGSADAHFRLPLLYGSDMAAEQSKYILLELALMNLHPREEQNHQVDQPHFSDLSVVFNFHAFLSVQANL